MSSRLEAEANTAILHVDLQGSILSVNDDARESYGLAQARSLADLISCAQEHLDQARVHGRWTGTCQTRRGQPVTTDISALRSSADTLGFIVSLRASTAETPQVSGSAADAAREALTEILVEAQALAHVGCFEWDLASDRLTWSEEMFRIFGADHASFGGTAQDFFARIHPEDRDRIAAALGAALESQTTFSHEERIVRPNGEVRELSSSGRVVRDANGQPLRVIGACLDITERKCREARLHEQVASLEALAELARDAIADPCRPVGSAVLDRIADHLQCEIASHVALPAPGAADSCPTFTSSRGSADRNLELTLSTRCIEAKSAWSMRGDSDEAAHALRDLGLTTYAVTPLLANGRVLGTLAFGSRTREAFSPSELDFIRTTGQLVAASLEKVEANRQLAANELRFRTVLDSAGDAIFLIDEHGKFVDVNRQACSSLGYSREDLLQMGACDIEVALAFSEDGKLLHDTRPPLTPKILSGVHLRKDGSCFPVEIRSSRAEIDGVQVTIAIARNLSERKLLEEQLIQSQKMEAVGLLAGGIAHDFNNLLTVINTTADLLLSDPNPTRDAIEANLHAIHEAGNQAADLTTQLLLFSRKSLANIEQVEIGGALEACEKLLRRVIGEDISLVVEAPDTPITIEADARQIEQIIMNLAINARDAMPDGGSLRMRTQTREIAEDDADRLDIAAGQYAEVTVEDDGCGMCDAVRKRVFEPFFTTKEAGSGTGLGLSVVYGIVQQSKGHISIDSQPGQGTRISLLLPLADVDVTKSLAPSVPKAQHGSELVLLVEDEELVRRVVRQALERFGYKVLEAGTAREAVELAALHDDAVSLVLTDVIMPGVDGYTLADEIRRRRPGIKTLFMSGYPREAIARRVPESALDGALIRKPFTAARLAEQVRETLDAAL